MNPPPLVAYETIENSCTADLLVVYTSHFDCSVGPRSHRAQVVALPARHLHTTIMSRTVPYAVSAALLIALIAVLVRVPTAGPVEEYVPPVQGRNNTALFIVLPHHGLSNVHLATADALLERHPDVQVEFASFSALQGKVERISGWGQGRNSNAKPIRFHTISGRPYEDAIAAARESVRLHGAEGAMSPPGLPGIKRLIADFALYVSPWSAEEHLEIYHGIKEVIDTVNPAVVVLDTMFSPALDATRESNRLHAIITPNTLIDNFVGEQPLGGMLWKYPV